VSGGWLVAGGWWLVAGGWWLVAGVHVSNVYFVVFCTDRIKLTWFKSLRFPMMFQLFFNYL